MFGEHEWFITPVRVECEDKDVARRFQGLFLGEGRWVVDGDGVGVEYRVFEVRPGGREAKL